MEPNQFWLNRPPQLRERWDRVRWCQRAQTGPDRFAKRRVARQPKKRWATDLQEAPRGQLIATAEGTLRAEAMEAAAWTMEAAAWAREVVTGAEAWVRAGASESAAGVKGAEASVRAGATE